MCTQYMMIDRCTDCCCYAQINPVAGKKKKKKDTEVEENFYDIVDMDEGHAQEYITDTFITRFLNSSGFQTFMMAVIFVNAIELALRTSDELVRLIEVMKLCSTSLS